MSGSQSLFFPCFRDQSLANPRNTVSVEPQHLCIVGAQRCANGYCLPLQTFEAPVAATISQIAASDKAGGTVTTVALTSRSTLTSMLTSTVSPSSMPEVPLSTSASKPETLTNAAFPATSTVTATSTPACGTSATVGALIGIGSCVALAVLAFAGMLFFRRLAKKYETKGAIKERRITDTNPPVIPHEDYLRSIDMFNPSILARRSEGDMVDVDLGDGLEKAAKARLKRGRSLTEPGSHSLSGPTVFDIEDYNYREGPSRSNIDHWSRAKEEGKSNFF